MRDMIIYTLFVFCFDVDSVVIIVSCNNLLPCRNSEVLVPHVFQFLVMLSYEKYHSKPIIDMPRIIHRCDGIMASGMQPDTHGQFV